MLSENSSLRLCFSGDPSFFPIDSQSENQEQPGTSHAPLPGHSIVRQEDDELWKNLEMEERRKETEGDCTIVE